MHELAKHLTSPSMKRDIAMTVNWSVRNEEFITSDIQLAFRDGIPKSIRYELDDHPEDYCSLTYGYWFYLLSTAKVKDEIKRAEDNIKKIASSRAASLSNSYKSVRVPRRKKAKTGVLNSHKSPWSAHDRHHRAQCYCVLYKKSVMPDRKYMLYITKDCTGMRTKHSIKDGMGGPI